MGPGLLRGWARVWDRNGTVMGLELIWIHGSCCYKTGMRFALARPSRDIDSGRNGTTDEYRGQVSGPPRAA